MFRLVARQQWQTLRGPRSAIGTVCCPYRLAIARQYVTQATPNSKTFSAIRPLNSAILIPGSVKDTQPDDLINYINPVPHEHVAKDTFCVLLVTPSFASWLLQDDIFVAKAIRRAYSKAFTGAHGRLTIQALCAVVDKLPVGTAFQPGASLEDEVARRALAPPVGETGSEGVAFVTLPAAASVSSVSPRSSEKGAIDFTFSGPAAGNHAYSDTWRLPLANTVFQTGAPTTMFFSTWDLHCEQKHLEVMKKTDISHHGIAATASGDSSDQLLSALSIPLVPLTFPRKVEGCMGNIIRRVVGSEEKSVTASSELEKVVPQFFKARGEPAQPTTAWALVVPQSKQKIVQQRTMRLLSKRISNKEKGTDVTEVLWERLWQQPGAWNRLVPIALAEGARLHRVLSGGGGWGKKAGLLSLDPVPVSEEIPIRMEDATSAFDGPGDFSTALTPVVQDGDCIQFFISPTPPNQAAAEEHNGLEVLKSLSKERSRGWELGTVPSTVDSIPGGSWQHVGSDPKYVAVFRHTFGALAEGGMTLTRRLQARQKDPFSTVATTMVDVPYSRFWTVELTNQQGSTKDFKFSWQTDSKTFMLRPTKQQVQHTDQVVDLHSIPKLDPAPTLVRRVISKGALKSKLVADQLHRIHIAIRDVTEQHKTIMHTIRLRQRQVAHVDSSQNRTLLRARRSQQGLVAYQKDIERLSTHMKENESLSDRLQASIEDVVSRTPREVSQIPIRRFISNSRDRHTLNTRAMAAGARNLNETVVLLAEQYETIASRVKQRMERHEQFELSKREKRERMFSANFSRLSRIKNENTRISGNRPRETIPYRTQILIRRRVAVPQQRLDRLQASITVIQEELQRTSRYIDRLAWFTHAANKSAFEVYGMHTALRLRLGKMIIYRQKRLVDRTQGHQNKLGIHLLKTRLTRLRTYDEVLFSTQPGQTPQQICKGLEEIELQNHTQRALLLSTQTGGRLHGRRLLDNAELRNSSNDVMAHNTEDQPRIRYRRAKGRDPAIPMNRNPRNQPQHTFRYMSVHRIRAMTWRPRPTRQVTSGQSQWLSPQSRISSATEKRKSDKRKLVDTVGSWLGSGVEDGAAASDARPSGRRRPFGSRAFGDEERGDGL